MGRCPKIQIKIKLCLLLVLIGITTHAGQASTGDFIFPARRDYYPETELTLELTNLTINDYYGILIGANQNISDQQWINFTAFSLSKTIVVIHFDRQNYLDNQNRDISTLLIELYAIANDSDSSPTELSFITYNLVRIKDQINPYVIAMLIVVGVTSIVIINLVFVFVKKFW